MSDLIRNHWDLIRSSVAPTELQQPLLSPDANRTTGLPRTSPSPSSTNKSLIQVDEIQDEGLALYESQERGDGETIFGIILQQPRTIEPAFDDVFVSLLLKSIKLFDSLPPHPVSDIDSKLKDTTDAIVDLFDARLRYISTEDKWSSHGREYLSGRVHEFVRRGERIEFCLLAFPCKSSSIEKVFGTMPDRGEQLALEHLHSFVEAIEHIYEPGAKLWIVSDGHVFSDCIGVDDEMVDRYNAQLISMNATIGQRRGGADRVGFKSLVVLFNLEHSMAELEHIRLPALPSYISTQRTSAAELSRQMLVQGCKTREGVLRSRIESGSHSTLKLYCGFSRFMLEDLKLNRYTKHLSRSKLKKLGSKVAFEMIQRNEAYSNLVELLFPYHVRLSIHAHDNAGPKFGIRLFGHGVRALETLSFDAAEMTSFDLLHVPTPWHNCLVEVAGHHTLFMVKSKAVRDALSSGKFSGGWVDGSHQGVAGHFRLQLATLRSDIGYRAESVAGKRGGIWDSQANVYYDDLEKEYPYMSTAAVEVDLIHGRAALSDINSY
ncbi:hypothetical protein DL764_005280 [Monosporascus ibericus]|uniref:Pyoverdine/dityrosine biosynthesis protein n=1 Tax=Monosporascus ibericus TaxID=155417 RepID=A0A4Q4TDG4_9PEZI|nr:hypothetical protein DL764_005280 [Monosporascus ibericus]